MDDPTPPTVDELAARCRRESGRPLPADRPSACWELFRRAVVENDQQAWAALHVQYRRLIAQWGAGTGHDLDDLVWIVLDRFWRGVRDHDFPHRFPKMAEVMRFLKWCARSEAIDQARRRDYQRRVGEKLTEARCLDRPAPNPEAQVFAGELREHLYSLLQGEDERLVFYLSWELDLKPHEIADQHPRRFADARAVSRIKERILRRLREDPVVQEWRA